MKFVLLVLVWSIYLALHSLLASDKIKAYVREKMPGFYRYYRLFYTVLSTLGLMAILFLMLTLPANYIFQPGAAIRYIALVLSSWGVIIIIVSFRKISGLAFLGLRKESSNQLITSGIHAWVRHPIYSGTILIFTGMFLYVPTDIVLTAVIINFIYLPIGIYFEEQKLINEFGDAYVAYKKRVAAIIPWVL